MSLAREILPDRTYLLTRRCTQRQFLMRPDAAINNAFFYCLIVAAQRCDIEIVGACAMSNHYHAVVYDPHGRAPEFTAWFHQFLSKCINDVRGRRENALASEQTSVVRLLDPEDVLQKVIYTLSNPVKDHLVAKAIHWPGCQTYTALLQGRPLTATRPGYFRRDSALPARVSQDLLVPASLGPRAVVVARVQAGVEAVELAAAQRRACTGRRVVGRKGILAQPWQDAPETPATRPGIKPTVAGHSKWHRIAALQRNHVFQQRYRVARDAMRARQPAVFPPGTYWRKRFLDVDIEGVA